jgi:hypothetical protein
MPFIVDSDTWDESDAKDLSDRKYDMPVEVPGTEMKRDEITVIRE